MGLKEQVTPAGVEQLGEIGLSKPPTAAALIVTLAVPSGATLTLWVERVREKFWPAAEGVSLANTLVVLPLVGKLGSLLPPAVK